MVLGTWLCLHPNPVVDVMDIFSWYRDKDLKSSSTTILYPLEYCLRDMNSFTRDQIAGSIFPSCSSRSLKYSPRTSSALITHSYTTKQTSNTPPPPKHLKSPFQQTQRISRLHVLRLTPQNPVNKCCLKDRVRNEGRQTWLAIHTGIGKDILTHGDHMSCVFFAGKYRAGAGFVGGGLLGGEGGVVEGY